MGDYLVKMAANLEKYNNCNILYIEGHRSKRKSSCFCPKITLIELDKAAKLGFLILYSFP